MGLLIIVAIVFMIGLAYRLVSLTKELKSLELNFSQRLERLRSEFEELKSKTLSIRGKGAKKEPETAPPKPQTETTPLTWRPIEQPGSFVPTHKTPAVRTRTSQEWEALVGGKILNRIGALALIIGAGFFLKYAFDNNWVTPLLRVLIGGVAGAICLVFADQSRKKGFIIFSQGLVGAGIAILYLSIYATFNFYHLVPQVAAFVLMSIVTTAALAIGFSYNSIAVALLGWTGGFLTPLMLNTGQSNEVGLFTYIALLDLGLIGTLVKKNSWFVLEPLTLCATWIMYFLWFPDYTRSDLWITVFFIAVFWILFFGLEVVHTVSHARKPAWLTHLVPALNATISYIAFYVIFNRQYHDSMAVVTVAVGLVYFGTMRMLERRSSLNEGDQSRFVVTAIALAVLATAIQFSDMRTVMFWSLEAGALVWCWFRWKSRAALYSGLGLLGLSFFKLLATEGAFSYVPVQEFTLIFNERFLTFILLAAAAGWMSFFLRYDEKKLKIAYMLDYFLCLILFSLVSVECGDWFLSKSFHLAGDEARFLEFSKIMALGVIWTAYSVPLLWLATKKGFQPYLLSALICLALAAMVMVTRGIAFYPLSHYDPVLNVRAAAVIIFGAAAIFHSTRLSQGSVAALSWIPKVVEILRVAIVLTPLLLVTGETRDFFQKEIVMLPRVTGVSDEILRLENLQQLSLSGAWLLYSFLLMGIGLWLKQRIIRLLAIGLFGLTILKIFIYDLSFLETLYRIFSFVGLGLILLTVSYVYQRYKEIIMGGDSSFK